MDQSLARGMVRHLVRAAKDSGEAVNLPYRALEMHNDNCKLPPAKRKPVRRFLRECEAVALADYSVIPGSVRLDEVESGLFSLRYDRVYATLAGVSSEDAPAPEIADLSLDVCSVEIALSKSGRGRVVSLPHRLAISQHAIERSLIRASYKDPRGLMADAAAHSYDNASITLAVAKDYMRNTSGVHRVALAMPKGLLIGDLCVGNLRGGSLKGGRYEIARGAKGGDDIVIDHKEVRHPFDDIADIVKDSFGHKSEQVVLPLLRTFVPVFDLSNRNEPLYDLLMSLSTPAGVWDSDFPSMPNLHTGVTNRKEWAPIHSGESGFRSAIRQFET